MLYTNKCIWTITFSTCFPELRTFLIFYVYLIYLHVQRFTGVIFGLSTDVYVINIKRMEKIVSAGLGLDKDVLFSYLLSTYFS